MHCSLHHHCYYNRDLLLLLLLLPLLVGQYCVHGVAAVVSGTDVTTATAVVESAADAVPDDQVCLAWRYAAAVHCSAGRKGPSGTAACTGCDTRFAGQMTMMAAAAAGAAGEGAGIVRSGPIPRRTG